MLSESMSIKTLKSNNVSRIDVMFLKLMSLEAMAFEPKLLQTMLLEPMY